MSDIVITVVAIFSAGILLFVFPLITTADRVDDVTQLTVEAATTDFIDKVRAKGKITEPDYSEFLEIINSTGNTYNVELEVQVLDVNLEKSGILVDDSKIGENGYISVYTFQIEEEIRKNGEFKCPAGSMASARVENESLTFFQQMQKAIYSFVGNGDTYAIVAQHAGMVTANGK